ncbi:hypothetical protein LXL04_002805 [Taraxacum kok-saghyz]
MHLLKLAEAVKEGVQDAGLIGFRFNTIGVSDAISMGTRGMCYSLHSRDLIADSIETVMSAQWYDANISIPGCDKNMPGTIMAMGRLNRPSIMIYGGTIKYLRNAMVTVMALGGSTNAVLHLIAIARSIGLSLTLDDFQKVLE